jgi:hypothetical protein
MESESNPGAPQSQHSQHRNYRDRVGRLFFGLTIIWLGVSFLLREHNFLYHSNWWTYFVFGLGIIFIAEAIVRMIRPEFKRPYLGKMIAGSILVALGASNIYGMQDWWPVILIVAGAAIILLTFQRKNESWH